MNRSQTVISPLFVRRIVCLVVRQSLVPVYPQIIHYPNNNAFTETASILISLGDETANQGIGQRPHETVGSHLASGCISFLSVLLFVRTVSQHLCQSIHRPAATFASGCVDTRSMLSGLAHRTSNWAAVE